MKRFFLLWILFVATTTLFAQTVAQDLSVQGVAALKNDDPEQAFKLFDESIKLEPNSHKMYFNRGMAYLGQKKYKPAISDFTKAIGKGGDLNVLFMRANAYFAAGDFTKAIADFTLISERNIEYPSVFFGRAKAYMAEGKFKEAKDDLQVQLKMEPNNLEYLSTMVQVNSTLKLYDEALVNFEDILAEYSKIPQAYMIYYDRSKIFEATGEFEKALSDLSKSIGLKGDFNLAIFSRAVIHLKMGNENLACDDLKKAMELDVEFDYTVLEDYNNLKQHCP
ncbi:tetratricopeptide repeat protein [Flavobacterium sp. JP2137]|uniref:tetratricopeptide repeat protein n=1 Tax=Flavobacterium sp. JP2137 TaxID=3414510 RepID=UPI003D2FE396